MISRAIGLSIATIFRPKANRGTADSDSFQPRRFGSPLSLTALLSIASRLVRRLEAQSQGTPRWIGDKRELIDVVRRHLLVADDSLAPADP
jgi:hypothetical protein